MTLQPAYGRDYKSAAALKADFEAGKDFVVADLFSGNAGSYTNKTDLLAAGVRSVNVRYAAQRKVCVIKVAP